MTRKIREYSKTNIYHVIIKGIDSQDIFYDDRDKQIFLEKLVETKRNIDYKIYAYCLMSNHVHMVIEIEAKFLSKAIQSLNIRYNRYFNNKYMRSGTLFQDRFKSKCVENQKYFLDVCRYVHQNPEKAKICKTEDYKWSSYHEYFKKPNIIDKNILLYYFDNNLNNFKIFTTKGKSDDEYDFMEYEIRDRIQDDELAEMIVKKLSLNNISEFTGLPKEEFEKGIEFLKNMKYTTCNQISRVTRINRYQLKKLWKRGDR